MNKIQRKNLGLFLLGLIIVLIGAGVIIFFMESNFLNNFQFDRVYYYASMIGILGAGVLGLAIGLFILRRVMKLGLDNILEPILKLVIKILQKMHIPLAMIGFFIISFHVYIFIHLGFKWNLEYIFGALAAIDLLILIISGVLRIFNKGIKNHKILGILFLILTIIHVLLVKI